MYDPKVHVGVGALLKRRTGVSNEPQILVIRRGPNATHGANTWGLPGGWIDYGQTPEEAAVRELEEELNVKSDVRHALVCGAVSNTYDNHEMHIVCVAVHLCSFDDSEMKLMEPDKHSDYGWMSLNRLRNRRVRAELFPPLASFARQWGWI